MKAQSSRASIIDPGIQGLTAQSKPASSRTRRVVPPPIFLRQESRIARLDESAFPAPRQIEAGNATPPSALALQAPEPVATPTIAQNAAGLLTRGLNWIRTRQLARSNIRRLQVAATVSLGDKRFVAVIQVDGHQFLVGGGASNVELLAQLDEKETFQELLNDSMMVRREPAGGLISEHAKEQA